jgi:hypothetical protein
LKAAAALHSPASQAARESYVPMRACPCTPQAACAHYEARVRPVRTIPTCTDCNCVNLAINLAKPKEEALSASLQQQAAHK